MKVSFYEEVNKYLYPTWGNSGVIYTTNGTGEQPYYYNNTVTNSPNFNLNSGNSAFFSSSFSDEVRGVVGSNGPAGVPGSLETGRAEKGESSSQNLESTTGDFNSWTTAVTEIQILPESQKPVEVEKIRSYCTACGTRVRSSSWKFCPACGEKL